MSSTEHIPKRNVTLTDMARHLGVSPSTVSQVLSGRADSTARVGEATADRVRQLSEEWGYRPNASARAMLGNGLMQVGFVLEYNLKSGRRAPFIALPAMLGISDYLTAKEWHLNIIQDSRVSMETKALPRYLREHLIDGVILNSTEPSKDEEILTDLRRFGIPHVILNGSSEYDSVCLDDISGISQGVEHLIRLGHSNIVFMGGKSVFHHSVMTRRNAYRDAMLAAGLAPHSWQYQTNPPAGEQPDSVHEAIREARSHEFLEFYRQNQPTAIVCYSDLDALLASKVLLENHIRIPEDISVVGYDDLPFVYLHHPPLTTLRSDFYQLGQEAAKMLLHLLKRPGEKIPSVILQPELVVRKSTSPPL
jgi:DNA-binding LacI/PurR family transcriptional regulator